MVYIVVFAVYFAFLVYITHNTGSIANRGSRFVNEFHILQAAFSDNRNCKICGLHNFFAIRSGLCYNFYIGVRKISDLKGDYL